jgi:hypothetical protein
MLLTKGRIQHLRGRQCDTVVLNVHATNGDKSDDALKGPRACKG